MPQTNQTPNPGLLVIFGSGECAPSSVSVYDWLMSRIEPPLRVSILETPAGFELNSAQVAGRIATFLSTHLTQHAPRITVVPARRRGSAFSPDDAAIVAPLYESNIILLGPGSPTYAVRQLRDSLAWQALLARHRLGAAIVLASAAAIAAGAQALPVYEIFKVGDDPHWQPGLDLLGVYGLKLAIVPHWNNADGGADLDTSHCFMGAERFQCLRGLLPPDIVIAGIDEQTALVLDLAAESCLILGQGGVSLLQGAQERRYEHGQQLPLAELGQARRINPDSGLPAEVWQQAVARRPQAPGGAPSDPALWAIVRARERLRARHDWTGADQLREQLAGLGWQVEDTPLGPRLRR